jgi:hypothetical protein
MTNVLSQDTDNIFKKRIRKDISNALVLTGGGAAQAYFAMGCCGCLHQNGMLDVDSYDVITSVSGGAILAIFLELCFLYKYDLEDDWYNKYVREGGIYAATKSNILANLVANIGDITKTAEYLGNAMPAWNRYIEEGDFGRGPTFEYNYIDVQKGILSTDHTDVVNFETGIRKPNWLFTRLARTTLPMLISNNKLSADAGLGANIPVSTLFDKYNIMHAIDIIKINPRYVRKTYPDPTISTILSIATFQALFMDTAADSIVSLVDRLYSEPFIGTVTTVSSEYDPSKDINHQGLFQDRLAETPIVQSFFQGVLYTDLAQIKILENEGYIQKYHELKDAGRLKEGFEFKIPNPDVYGPETPTLYKETLDRNIPMTVVGDIFTACIR